MIPIGQRRADLDHDRPHRYASRHARLAQRVPEGLGRDPFAVVNADLAALRNDIKTLKTALVVARTPVGADGIAAGGLEASATEDELAAEIAAAKTSQVAAFTRTRPACWP